MSEMKDPFTRIKYLLFQIFLLILFVVWLIRMLRHETGLW
jgi:flagellar biogenesis protein FliO